MVLSDSQWFYFKTANVIGTNCFALDTWPKKMVHHIYHLCYWIIQCSSPHFWCDIHACVPVFGTLHQMICKIDFKAFTIWCKLPKKGTQARASLLILTANFVCWFAC